MARMSDHELGDIISRDLPGHRIVRRKDDEAESADADFATATDADEVSPDLDELRRKYLGEEGADTATTEAMDTAAPSADPQAEEEADTHENTDDEIVIVEKEASPDPFGHRARPKAVVVSGKDKRVVGYQG